MTFNAAEYHRSVEISRIRQHMKYGQGQYEEDWSLAIALAVLMSDGGKDHFKPMLESCFNRILAYQANNPEELPFERHSL